MSCKYCLNVTNKNLKKTKSRLKTSTFARDFLRRFFSNQFPHEEFLHPIVAFESLLEIESNPDQFRSGFDSQLFQIIRKEFKIRCRNISRIVDPVSFFDRKVDDDFVSRMIKNMTETREELSGQVGIVDDVGDEDDLHFFEFWRQIRFPVFTEKVDFFDAEVWLDQIWVEAKVLTNRWKNFASVDICYTKTKTKLLNSNLRYIWLAYSCFKSYQDLNWNINKYINYYSGRYLSFFARRFL